MIDRSLTPRDGDVVVVDVDGERSFKVWTLHAGVVTLAFANRRLPAYVLDREAVIEVWGRRFRQHQSAPPRRARMSAGEGRWRRTP